MAIQKHNAYYESESGLYYYDESGNTSSIEISQKSNSWKEWSEELSSSGNDSIYIGIEDSAYQNSITLGDSAFAISGGAVIGKNSVGGRDGYVIGDDNKIKIWNNTSSQYLDLETSNVVNDNYTLKNSYYFVPQYAFGENNTVNHGKGPYIGDYGIMPFQIGCDNMVLDLMDFNSMPQNLRRGATYNIGRANSAVNAGINIGGNNKILTGDDSVGASINIGKNLVNRYGILIGQYLSSNGYSFNIGENSTTYSGGYSFGAGNNINNGGFGVGKYLVISSGSFGLGYSNTVNDYSFIVGRSNSGQGNSFACGDYNITSGASYTFGKSNSANGASFAIGDFNKINGYSKVFGYNSSGDSYSFVLGNNNNAERYSYVVGYNNNVKNYTFAIGYNNNNNTLTGESYIFGYENTISGTDPDNKNYSYTTTIIGKRNILDFHKNDNFYGIILGDENNVKSISNNESIAGYNIYLGKGNSGSCEAINIGTQNDTVGHSIGLGWRNIANTNSYAHSILLGKENYSDTNRPELIPWSAQSGKYVRRVEDGDIVYKLENPETNNFVVGTNNSASHYNSIIIGSVNQTLSAVPNPEAEEGEELYDDDGFTVALGLGNIAARNYDMAIGYATLASGGENIAIGSPQMDADYDELLWHTNAVGYRNIAIRSNVSGIGNIAFESNFEGKGINNVILNSQISGTTDGYDEYPYARNDIRYTTGEFKISNNFTDNVIKTTTANIDCKGYCVNNIIQNSYIDVSSNENIVNNFINTTTASGETYSFRHNVIFFSDIDVTSGDYNFESTNQNQNVSNFLVGVSAKNVNATFAFADKNSNSLQEVVRSVSLGDNHLNRVRGSFVFGANIVTNAEMSFVAGYGNGIYVPCSSYDDAPASMEYILGADNTINFTTITSTNCRNKIFGNSNVIYAESDVTDNVLIGNGNSLIYFTNVPDNHARFPDIPYYDETHDTYALYRNVVLGSNNAISQCISNGFIVGDSNVLMTTNTGYEKDDSLYDSSIILGFGNVAYNGSQQLSIGSHNNVSGHFAYALGEELSAQDFQMVVGKYNAPVPKTERAAYAKVGNSIVEVENSGVLFAIGNGRLKVYEESGSWYDPNEEYHISIDEFDEDYIERSNAMIVSANGTVSAGDFEISGCKLSDIIDVVTLLKNKPVSGQPYIMGLDNSGNLTWMSV